MFAGKTKDIEIIDEGEKKAAVIRKLSWTQRRDAAKALSREFVSGMREMGGELVKALKSEGLEAAAALLKEQQREKTLEEKLEERYGRYAQDITLKLGIHEWPSELPITEENIGKLDPDVADQFHKAIVDFMCGPIDVEAAESKG